MAVVVRKHPKDSQKKPLLVIINSKTAKKAVERNLIKRRIKCIMRPLMKKAAFDCVVITKPGVEKLSFAETEQEIKKQI